MDKEEKKGLEFIKGDVDILNFIIDVIIKDSTPLTYESEVIKNNPYFDFNKKGYENDSAILKRKIEFTRLLSIIESYGCANCEFENLSERINQDSIKSKKGETLQFKKLGGFTEIYKRNLKSKQREEKLIKKEATDLWIASKTKKTFWYVMIGGFVSWGFTFYNNYINDKNNNIQIGHIQQLLQENKEQVKELHTLILNQKKDSL